MIPLLEAFMLHRAGTGTVIEVHRVMLGCDPTRDDLLAYAGMIREANRRDYNKI